MPSRYSAVAQARQRISKTRYPHIPCHQDGLPISGRTATVGWPTVACRPVAVGGQRLLWGSQIETQRSSGQIIDVVPCETSVPRNMPRIVRFEGSSILRQARLLQDELIVGGKFA